ncbi:PilZ domain-containing protein [Palleronia sp. LCG004]|uniref:PilZ domain-containing protein n=1 Tax=Palleronia sp. LCG004 TaxID=3079304 RepID=UPI002942F1EC|nr:PilZ domain-containing protein [Palleronia sp. LCG004]WOI57417.1 PilZ domain-containing protein [Palleronia sp. LCG004]
MDIRDRRWPSEVVVLIESRGERVKARVGDVSEGGIKMRSPKLSAEPGQVVTLFAARQSATGEIRWSRGDVYGVSFRPPLSDDMLAALTNGLYRAPTAEIAAHRRSQTTRGRHRPAPGYLATM